MKLRVIDSGSSGNCYLLENEEECLVVESGIPFMEVKKALNFNIKKIVGVVVSHVHGDHSKYISDYEKAGISVFKPYLDENAEMSHLCYGNFKITSFSLVHDVPCCGFYIVHPEIGILVYASDTEYIKYRFKNVNHFLVEANYSMDFVDKDKPNYEHVLQGHMSIETTCDFLKANNNPVLRTVTLCHLSANNADSSYFKNRAEQVVDCHVEIARKGLCVDVSLVPF